jgi:cell wall-associated NlpC family hydrolase
MNKLRILTALPLVAAAALSFGQQVALGRLGQVTEPSAVYSSPSVHARMYYRLSAYEYMVFQHSKNSNWDRVLLKNGSYAYTPSYVVAELPYTVLKKQSRHVADTGYYSTPRVAATSSRGGAGVEMANYALNFTGTPYEWGGNDLRSGIDCSGFVKKIAGAIGEDLPRTAAEQATVGQPIYRLEDLEPGDRLYFKERSETRISHTGIYLGNGRFIHSSHGKGGVASEALSAAWCRMLVSARR